VQDSAAHVEAAGECGDWTSAGFEDELMVWRIVDMAGCGFGRERGALICVD